MLPAAPGLLSTTTCWPRPTVRRGATCRAATSGALPAMNGTIMRTGLSGYSAWAALAVRRQAAIAKRARPLMSALLRLYAGVPECDLPDRDLVFHVDRKLSRRG